MLPFRTTLLPVDAGKIGRLRAISRPDDLLDELEVELDESSEDGQNLRLAVGQLQSSNIPVSFPTETVYGLGADATRPDAVRGIYKAKQRPVDNPLIVHFSSLKQLRELLRSGKHRDAQTSGHFKEAGAADPIPAIYHPLIRNFWPGPLTIILPNPPDSPLAPEVTAGLRTFGARMPRHLLALTLIELAGVPVAAPSANASTKPSPTAAEHVAYDLDGRIETIIDGGPCDVGVESTVVDGLCQPPVILRPGGVSLEQLQNCPGWEDTQIGYKNVAEIGGQPRAPGMKYRHYSPKATVILLEAGVSPPSFDTMLQYASPGAKLGLITTRLWEVESGDQDATVRIAVKPRLKPTETTTGAEVPSPVVSPAYGFAGLLDTLATTLEPRKAIQKHVMTEAGQQISLLEISLGPETTAIARGIFAALRELDKESVDAIIVEGIDDGEGQTAAAVMNRLRKAATFEAKVNA